MIATLNTFGYLKRNFPVVLGIFGIYFLMTYSEGLHEGTPLIRFHVVPLALMLICFVINTVLRKESLYRAKMGTGVKIASFLFLIQIVNASMVAKHGLATAINVVAWHVASYVYFAALFARIKPRANHAGVVVACWGICVYAVVLLAVGLYIQYIGDIRVGGWMFAQSIHRGLDYYRLISWCTSPSRTGPMLLYGILGGFVLCRHETARQRGNMLRLGMAGLLIGVILTGSRSAIIVTISMGGVYAVLAPRRNMQRGERSFPKWAIPLLALPVIIVGMRQQNVLDALFDHSRLGEGVIVTGGGVGIASRESVHANAMHVFRSAPASQKIFGVGMGAILHETGISSHSGWLNVMVETGIAGLGILAFFFMAILADLYRMLKHRAASRQLKASCALQLAFWVGFAMMNVTTSIIPVIRADNFFMCMMFALYGHTRVIFRQRS